MLDLTTFTASECLIYLLIKPVKVTVSDNIDRISREEPATMTKNAKNLNVQLLGERIKTPQQTFLILKEIVFSRILKNIGQHLVQTLP